MASLNEAQRAAEIVRDAGGHIVGRTRLQKIAYFLEAAGCGAGFPFRYKHYGPYSEPLADAAQTARIVGLLQERETPATWGGSYSTFSANIPPAPSPNYTRQYLANEMSKADAVELELAATALYLYRHEGHFFDAWEETARRKPDKAANGRLEKAKLLYRHLQRVTTAPNPLPSI